MTDDELRAIEQLTAKASPAPWKIGSVQRLRMGLFEQDLDFIETGRTAVPALTAEVRRLQAALCAAELRGARAGLEAAATFALIVTGSISLADAIRAIDPESVPVPREEV